MQPLVHMNAVFIQLEKLAKCIFPCCVERNIRVCHQCNRLIREFESIYFVCNTEPKQIPLEDNNIFCSNNCRAKYLLTKYPNSPTSESDSYSSSYFSISSNENTPTNYEVVKRKTKNQSTGLDYHEF